MPRDDGLPPGTLVMLVLRVLATEALHGYAIAQRIAQRSGGELSVEEGSLYPALQKLLLKGWVKATPAISDTGRQVREYRLTPSGRRQLEAERGDYQRRSQAIAAVLDTAKGAK
jgi:PadR family transcriptional regulator PadR